MSIMQKIDEHEWHFTRLSKVFSYKKIDKVKVSNVSNEGGTS